MWAIIEGSDFAGKSTLVELIAKHSLEFFSPEAIEVLHRSKPDPETRETVLRDYVWSLIPHHSDTNDLLFNERALISDRWHFGEAVYAPLKRPHTNHDGFGLLGVAGWRFTELFLLSRGAVTFWLQPPLQVLLSRSKRGDDYIKTHELSGIMDLYQKAMTVSATAQCRLTDQDDPDWVATMIVETAMNAASEAAHLAPFSTYIGPPKPKLLVVTSVHLSPVSEESSLLYDCLPEYFWQRVGFINVDDIGLELGKLHTALGCPPMVTLGEQAVLAAHDIEVTEDFTMLHDPAWVLQFEPDRIDEYGAAFEAVSQGREVAAPWQL